jgi:hypothetical protein
VSPSRKRLLYRGILPRYRPFCKWYWPVEPRSKAPQARGSQACIVVFSHRMPWMSTLRDSAAAATTIITIIITITTIITTIMIITTTTIMTTTMI